MRTATVLMQQARNPKHRIKIFVLSGLVALFYVFGVLTHLFERDYYSEFTYPLEVRIDEIPTLLESGDEVAVKPLNTFDYMLRIENANKCKSSKTGQHENVVILFVIKSAIPNKLQRDAIRRSWGYEKRFSDVVIRRIFVLGSGHSDPKVQDAIDDEYHQNGDIVQADFMDTYYNNTIKTMIGFKWAFHNCPRAQFVMFSDDDMYISTKNLLKFLRNPSNENLDFQKPVYFAANDDPVKDDSPPGGFDNRLLAGYVFFSSPMRHIFSKWYVDINEYPFSMYPPYVTAGAYVMTFPVLKDMYHMSMYTKMFRFDDIFVGIVAKKCGIKLRHNENFYFWKKPYDKNSYSNVIASHGFHDPQELVKVWEEQKSLGHA